MRSAGLLLVAALLPAWLAAAEPANDQQRVAEIRAKIRKGEPVSPEERAFVRELRQRRNDEYMRNHLPQDSTGMIPLTDLGAGTYKGEQGGLYPGGLNVPPASHERIGRKRANRIQPIDGKIVMISTGMSNTTLESQVFATLLKGVSGVNPKFLFVDCAQGGQTAHVTADPDADYWKVSEQRLAAAGVTAKQVQITWIKQANAGPTAAFPEEVRKLEADLLGTVHNLRDKYPNLKIVYLSSRIYAGYAKSPLNPEPHAYEGGFAVKWLIADQIAGKPELSYDKNPWLAWGPYLWADGVKPRGDGLTYLKDDLVESDRTHPSLSGREKVARQLLDFLKMDPTSTLWFLQYVKVVLDADSSR